MSFFNGSTLTWVPPPVTCKGAYLANLSGLILQQHFARDRHFWGISRRDVPRLAACVGRFPWGLQGDKRATGRSRSHHPEIGKAGRLGNDRPSLGARLGCGISKPWGVWEGGFDERPGEPPAGYLDFTCTGGIRRLVSKEPLRKRAQSRAP